MTDTLILYIDYDFIYPVVASGHGEYERFEHPDRAQRDFRLWLYFETDTAASRVTWAKRARAPFLSGNPACEGDIFHLFGSNKKDRAAALLSDSGLVSTLKSFYCAGGSRSETDIPTAYIFAGNIPEAARRDFIAYMQSRSFATLSYSVTLEKLASTLEINDAKFGDKLLTYTSSGSDLIASCFVFDSPEYMLTDHPTVMHRLGYNPLREALVNYVVNKIDSKQHFLTSQERLQAEIEYQKQNVDEWLRDIDLDDSVSTIAFRYNNRANEYQVSVESDLLKNKQNEFIEHLLSEMNTFRNRAARSSESPVSKIILIGEMFADEGFRNRVAVSVGRGAKVSYLPPVDFAPVLASYCLLYPQLRESLKDFERIARISDDKVSGTAKFIDNADKLRSIADMATEISVLFGHQAETLSREIDASTVGVEEMLKISNFNAAEEALSRVRLPENDSSLSARYNAFCTVLTQSRDLLGNPNAQGIARAIAEASAQINSHLENINAQLKRVDLLKSEIARLRTAWPEYQRLMNEFGSASVIRKQEIIEEIKSKSLTREPLPVTGLTAPFLAKIEAAVNKTGGFLGFGGKKTLAVSISTAEGYTTECKTVVLVQDAPLVTIRPSNIRATIDVGFTGKKILEPIPLPLEGNSSAKRIYIYLKPAPDQAIGINDPFMTVKSIEVEI